MMEDSLAEDRHSPVPGPRPSLPGPGADAGHDPVRVYCRYCTRSRIVGDPTQNFNRRDHEAQLEYLRRTPQVRDVLISGGDGLTLAPKLFEKILRGLREIPHIEIIRIGSRVPVFLPQRIDDELCEMLEKYHPLWINLHFNHPNEITPGGLARGRQADEGRPAGRQPERAARRRERLRPHPARARPQARREPDPALLPLPVRPGRGLRPLPDAGRQGPRDHGGPARPHLGLRRADLRDRRARRRRQDPGHAELPDQLLGPQGRAAQLRGLHHDLRGAPTYQRHDEAACAYCQHERPEPGQSGVLGLLEGERMWIEPKGFEDVHTRGNTEAHRLQDPSKWVPFGVGAIEGQSRRAAAASSSRATRPRTAPRRTADVRPRRGTAAARRRADGVGPRGAALASTPRNAPPARGVIIPIEPGEEDVRCPTRCSSASRPGRRPASSTPPRLIACGPPRPVRSTGTRRQRRKRRGQVSFPRSWTRRSRSSRCSRTSAAPSSLPAWAVLLGRLSSEAAGTTQDWLRVVGFAVPAAVLLPWRGPAPSPIASTVAGGGRVLRRLGPGDRGGRHRQRQFVHERGSRDADRRRRGAPRGDRLPLAAPGAAHRVRAAHGDHVVHLVRACPDRRRVRRDENAHLRHGRARRRDRWCVRGGGRVDRRCRGHRPDRARRSAVGERSGRSSGRAGPVLGRHGGRDRRRSLGDADLVCA